MSISIGLGAIRSWNVSRSSKSPKKSIKTPILAFKIIKVSEFNGNREPVYDFLLVINGEGKVFSWALRPMKRRWSPFPNWPSARHQNLTLPDHGYGAIVSRGVPVYVPAVKQVPNYTAWWQRHMCVNNLPKVVTRQCPGAESNLRLWVISGLQVRHVTIRLPSHTNYTAVKVLFYVHCTTHQHYKWRFHLINVLQDCLQEFSSTDKGYLLFYTTAVKLTH